jgi:hypothetical protein
MWHAWGRRETHTGLWYGNLKEIDLMEGLGVDGLKVVK